MVSNPNVARVCPKCFIGSGLKEACEKCGGETRVVNLGKKITLPKKNDRRAWKRIFSGEVFWNRRKVQKHNKNTQDTYLEYEYIAIPIEPKTDCGHAYCARVRYKYVRVPGSDRERTNYGRHPDIDLGG